MPGELDHYKELWSLSDDGEPFMSYSGILQPVLYHSTRSILKITRREKDKCGNMLMAWWNGVGAAPILQFDGAAILMERATGEHSLTEMAKSGHDDNASRAICSVVAKLHTHPKPYPKCLVPLDVRFRSLRAAAGQQGGIFIPSLQISEQLLSEPQEVVALHGDIHHGNIIDFGEKGWLAIDPKGLIGERGFDYANIFCNPDRTTATAPGRLERQVKIISKAADLEPKRLLEWIAAWAGLSAAWSIEDGEDPETALKIAEIAISKIYLYTGFN